MKTVSAKAWLKMIDLGRTDHDVYSRARVEVQWAGRRGIQIDFDDMVAELRRARVGRESSRETACVAG